MKFKIALLVCVLFISCQPEQNSTDNLLGQYRIGGGLYAEVILDLKENGKFVHEFQYSECAGNGYTYRTRGNYNILNDRLILEPISAIYIDYFNNILGGLVKDSIIYQNIKTQDYQIVKWDKLVYLLSEANFLPGSDSVQNDYVRFIEDLNCGFEPSFGHCFGKRIQGYKPNIKFDKLSLPVKYQNKILDEPVIAKVLKIDSLELDDSVIIPLEIHRAEIHNDYIFKLDKGKKDGVTVGLKFFTYMESNQMEIAIAEENVSYGIMPYYNENSISLKEGEELSTSLIW